MTHVPGRIFGKSNVDALMSHLPNGSLSARLVSAVAEATDEGAARGQIGAVTAERYAEERAKLDAKDSQG